MDVVIVGGGPAGLFAAVKFAEAGFNTTIIEEHMKIGYPEHCTGIVREDFVKVVGYNDLERIVLAKYSGGYVSVELGGELHEIDVKSVKAVMIDRPLYERLLSEYAVAAGARMVLGRRAEILRRNGSFCVKLGDEVVRPDFVIGARGPKANPSLKAITGLQAYVSTRTNLEEDRVYVALSQTFPDFFGWVAPFGDGRLAKVGVASSKQNLRESLHQLGKGFLGEGYNVRAYFGGLVVVGSKSFLSSIGGTNYLPIGDEAGLVKPLTGGGLDLGVFGVKKLVEDISRGNYRFQHYSEWFHETRMKILGAQLARRLLFSSLGLSRPVLEKLLKGTDLGSALQFADFDDHVGVLFRLIQQYVRSTVEGLL